MPAAAAAEARDCAKAATAVGGTCQARPLHVATAALEAGKEEEEDEEEEEEEVAVATLGAANAASDSTATTPLEVRLVSATVHF